MESGSGDRNLAWELIDTRLDRSYALFSVAINRNRSPRTGRIHEFQVLQSPDWVAVIAVTPQDEVVLVRQYRHGTGEISLEPPGGLCKDGQDPEKSAREELEEETGFRAASWELLGWMYPVPALFTSRMHVYLAREAAPVGRLNPDETEEVETVLVPVKDIRNLIRSGRLNCGVMIAALHLFLDKMTLHK